MRRRVPGLLVISAFIAIVIALRLAYGDRFQARYVVDLLEQVRASPFALPGFLLAYVTLTTLFVPAIIFHLASAAVWGFGPGLALNLVAFHLTANAQFALTRRFGAAWTRSLVGEARVKALEARLGDNGFRAVMLSRLLPIPAMVISVAYAVSPIRWRDFTLGSLIGTFPIILVPTSLATALIQEAEGARGEATKWLVVGGAAVVVFAVASRYARRRG